MSDQWEYRFDVHMGADCMVRYVRSHTRELHTIIYGPILYSIVLKWKEGGQSMYLQRLHELGMIARSKQ